jgi:hypothetical protein
MGQQATGHVYGASAALEHWLMRKFKEVAVAGGTPPTGFNVVLCFPWDEYFNPDFYTFQPVQYDIVERKGQVALWRITQAECYAVQPNPIGRLGACGTYDTTEFTSVHGFAFPYNSFGCGPFCGATIDSTPDFPVNLMMLTVGLARPRTEVEDYGWEYAVVVNDTNDSATIAEQWNCVLGLHMPSTLAFGLDTVSAIDTGNLYPTPITDPLKDGSPL